MEMKKNILKSFVTAAAVLAVFTGCTGDGPDEQGTMALGRPEVSVRGLSSTGFMLVWDAVENAGSYTYEFNGGEPVSTGDRTVSFSGLDNHTEYVVALKAEPEEGSPYNASDYTYVHVFTDDVLPLETPRIVLGCAYASNTIISWSVVSGASGYEYTIDGRTEETGETQAIISGLEPGREYTFSVKAVSEDIKSGTVEARNLRNKQKCIFLDRDGTVNELRGFVKKPEELVLKPEAAEAIRIINRSEYLCILVTNQPVVARGDCSFEELEEIHRKLETELGREGAYIDDIFFCPHHRDRGFSGEVPELKFACRCRKPEPGLLYEAAKRYNIDLEASWMIGDSLQDVLCGKRGGTRTLLLQDPQEAKGADASEAAEAADRTAGDLLSAVKQIIA